MANLRTAMDANFYDLELSSPYNLDGCAKLVPGQPIPLDGARASKALRVQQLSLLSNGLPLGLIPSISTLNSNNELGSFSLHSLLLRPSFGPWWIGLVGQFHPKKLISKVKLSSGGEWELHSLKEATKHFLDKSLYSLGACAHIPITSTSSLLVSSESHGERKRRRNKLMLYHKLPFHDISLDAAWPELFIDGKGRYWNVPESVSLDLLSNISESGLRYRFGLHKNAGQPQAISSIDGDAPAALLPGLCAKAAFSYEKHKDIWRVKEKTKDCIIETNRGMFWRPAYDVRMKEPHASVSAIIGGVCGTWLWGEGNPLKLKPEEDVDAGSISSSFVKRSRFFADLFGSMSSTFQHGKFRKPFGDLTRVDARLDFCSAVGFLKNVASIFRKSSDSCLDNPVGLPRLGLIFQQQIAGPIVFRIDTKYVLKPNSPWKNVLETEDFMYSLSYSLRLLESGKVVAWYSPKRKEGMIELRLFEF